MNYIKIKQMNERGSRFIVQDGSVLGCPKVSNCVEVEYLCETTKGVVVGVDGHFTPGWKTLWIDHNDGYDLSPIAVDLTSLQNEPG